MKHRWLAAACIVAGILATSIPGSSSWLLTGLIPSVNPNTHSTSLISEPEQQPLIVRAYFEEFGSIKLLGSRFEPWEVNQSEGYAVIEIYSQEELDWLEKQGFHIQVDLALTSQIKTAAPLLTDQVNGIPGYPCYRTVEETLQTAQIIVTSFPGLTEWIDIGDSWKKSAFGLDNGYDLIVLKLTNESMLDEKPKLFLTASMHAREYAPAELGLRFAEYLVNQYGIDPDVTWILDYHEIHILMQANPDGRKRAEEGLLWRKNVNNNYCANTSLRGADLNRNFDFNWGCCGGSSANQCDIVYRGPAAASEPETQAIQNYLTSLYPDRREDSLSAPAPEDTAGIYLDLHSYGELVLWPWGFTNNPAPNGSGLRTLGRKMAFFNDYTPYQSILLYPTDGDSNDFAYGDLGLPAYTIELGTSFFQDCSRFENEIYPDNLKTLLYAARVARLPYQTPSGPDTRLLQVSEPAITAGQTFTMTATVDDTRYSEAAGVEPSQDILYAAYSIDIPFWELAAVPITSTITATDGAFDEKVEEIQASIPTDRLSTGRHILFVRGQDMDGNWGPVSAVFFQIEGDGNTYFPIIIR